MRVVWNVYKVEGDSLLKPSELFMVYSLARAESRGEGDFAEVGCYRGLSAQLICEAKGGKELWVFDTFEGLPEIGELDTGFTRGMFSSDLDQVRRRLAKYPGVHLCKGVFPETAAPVVEKTFAFVHLDVDLYQSTKSCLEFFYPRMEDGGTILSHDYARALGVRRAFDEFFLDKVEPVIELPMSQCMVVRRKHARPVSGTSQDIGH